MTICIYHSNCSDGFGSAWVVRRALGETGIRFFPGVFDKKAPDCTGDDVVLVDFSYKRPVMEQIIAEAKSVLVLDHHASAERELADLASEKVRITFDMEKSGVILAWEHYFPNEPIPLLLKHIEDRDLWKFELPYTREIVSAIFSYPFEFAVWDAFDLDTLRTEGIALSRQTDAEAAQALRGKPRSMVIGGYCVPVVNASPKLSSDVGAELARGEPFGATYYDVAEGRRFSLRSNEKGVDVSVIAAQYGGGGHVRAAGFTLPWREVIKWETRALNGAINPADGNLR